MLLSALPQNMYYYALEMDLLLLKKVAILCVLCLCTPLTAPLLSLCPLFCLIFTCVTLLFINLNVSTLRVLRSLCEYCL